MLPIMIIISTAALLFVVVMEIMMLSARFASGNVNVGALAPVSVVLFMYALCRLGLKRNARRVLDILLDEHSVKLRKG